MLFKGNKYKRDKLKLKQDKVRRILESKDQEKLNPREPIKVLKKPVLLYDSDWKLATKEDIKESLTQEKYLILPERALYDFQTNINIPEQFIPDLKIEILIRSAPDTDIQGVFPYISSYKKSIKFELYRWGGVTYMTGGICSDGETLRQPQPLHMYVFTPPTPEETFGHYDFVYPVYNFPVPLGEDPSYVLPGAPEVFPNRIYYDICGVPTSPSYWYAGTEGHGFGSIVEFFELALIHGLQNAKDLLFNSYENITYIDETEGIEGTVATKEDLPLTGNTQGDIYIVPDIYFVWNKEEPDGDIDDWVNAGLAFPKAYETIYKDQVAIANQFKKVIRISKTNINLEISGDVLIMSPAKTLTDWSDPLFPTYKPTEGGDVEVRLKVYIDNPNYFTENKGYIDV